MLCGSAGVLCCCVCACGSASMWRLHGMQVGPECLLE